MSSTRREHGARALTLIALALTGCSYITVQGPKEAGPHCSTGYAAPIVDVSTVATIAVLLTTALDDECADSPTGCAGDAVTSPVTLIGALAASSAVYGGVVVRSCNNHREKMEREVASMIESLVPVAEAGACAEVRRAVVVAEEVGRDLGMKIALTNRAVLRCLVPAADEPAGNGT